MTRRVAYLWTVCLVILMATNTYAKRKMPEKVDPVVYNGVRYVVKHNATGGYVEARDANTDAKIWGLVVYKTKVDPNVEQDVQWVFITKIYLDKAKKNLVVENEAGDIYFIDLSTRKIRRAGKGEKKPKI